MSSSLKIVQTDNAPKAIGPYSQAIKANGLVFVSGNVGVDPSSGKVVEGGVEAQTHQVLKNLNAVLVEAGSSLNQVVKTNVYLKDMNSFQIMNKVYAEHFGEHRPARAAVEVARLPLDVLVEIECVALAP